MVRMINYAISAAQWVLSKALAPTTADVVRAWAASKNLGDETEALMEELIYVQAYDADDVLNELDYFRIQDELDGTNHSAHKHAESCVQGLLHHAHHTAKAVVAKTKPSSSSHDKKYGELEERDNSPHASPTNLDAKNINAKLMQKLALITQSTTRNVGNGRQVQTVQTPKLKFYRVSVSLKMENLVQKLKPICLKVSDVLNMVLLGSRDITITTMEQPITSDDNLEPKLYGRETEKKRVVDSITHGEYSRNEMTVLPIVGPGGIGKTTFAQHVYQQVKSHFQVTVWICVSLNFNANRLAQEAKGKIPLVQDEKEYGSYKEVIEQRLKGKRFFLVLDDIWKCDEDEWEKLLSPFRQGGGKGSMVIVTTRMSDVVNIVKTNGSYIELDRLGGKEFRDFFDSCVSTKNNSGSDHPELLETGEEIIAKLKGSSCSKNRREISKKTTHIRALEEGFKVQGMGKPNQ